MNDKKSKNSNNPILPFSSNTSYLSSNEINSDQENLSVATDEESFNKNDFEPNLIDQAPLNNETPINKSHPFLK
jgi:hypothetical protein